MGELIDRKGGLSRSDTLREHFNGLENEIGLLRKQQQAIVALPQEPEVLEGNMVTKERWVEIMKASGLDEPAMIRWHKIFEEMEPEEYQKPLESLCIDEDETKQIRSL
jgi:hypothetical protein